MENLIEKQVKVNDITEFSAASDSNRSTGGLQFEVSAGSWLADRKNARNPDKQGISGKILADGRLSREGGEEKPLEAGEADPNQVRLHLDLLSSLDRAKTFWIETRDDRKEGVRRDNLTDSCYDDPRTNTRWISRLNKAGAGIFVAVNPVNPVNPDRPDDGPRRRMSNVTTIRAVWGEFDQGLPKAFPIQPTFIVESSPGRFHAYWVCSGLTVDEFDGVMTRLVTDYGSDNNAKDRTRILRLAGTWHMKNPAKPWLVRIKEASRKTYSRDEILAAFPPIERKRHESIVVKSLELSAKELAAKVAQIREMLRYVPADLPYGEWLKVGAAIHHETAGSQLGLELFDEWSRTAPDKYDANGANNPAAKWLTFGSYAGEPAKMGTLVHIARSFGSKSPEGQVDLEIARLAALDPVIYDQQRMKTAKALGCRVETLDKRVSKKRAELETGAKGAPFEAIEPWPDPVDGTQLLDELVATIRRYVVLSDHAAEAVALWILFAHAHDAAQVSPLLALQSPEKRCGKTTLLLTVKQLVPKPLSGSNVTPAVLFRATDAYAPTLLLDEADTFITDENSELRGALNAGHNRGEATIWRCVGDSHELQPFKVWSPKVIAGIGTLPDTLQDRAIRIPLKRRTQDETVERLLQHETGSFAELRRKAARWAADNLEKVRTHDPDLPSELNDRAADNWRTILAIADISGGNWPEKARVAAIGISGENEGSTETWKVQLLGDIRTAFETADSAFPDGPHRSIGSEKLAELLASMSDRSYTSWGKTNKPISPKAMANALKHFGIKPKRLETGSAYFRADFEDAWRRYTTTEKPLPHVPPEEVQSARVLEKSEQHQHLMAESITASQLQAGTSTCHPKTAGDLPLPQYA